MTANAMNVPAAPARSGGRVWLVDDSRLESERASRLLSTVYTVEMFAEGAAMLEHLAEHALPDLILLDWQMPGVSGLEVCRFLRERFDEVSLPILMLTSRGAREDFTEGLSAGANDYVAKPYDDAELLARVRTLVRTRQQAQSMRAREEWFATTLRSIGDAVIATDLNGRVTFLNRAAEELTGWSTGEAFAQRLEDVFRVVDARTHAAFESPVGQVLRGGAAVALPEYLALLRRDGREVSIDASVSPIGDGEAEGAVLVFRDATERKKVDAEAKRRADFEEKLIGIVSHDLRNPLNVVVLGASTLLQQEDLDERTTKSALRMQRSAQRATRLVSDLLDFTQARLGSGIPVHRNALDMHALAAATLEEVQAAHPERDLQLEVAGDPHGEWDADRIAQVLTNLTSNALQYGTRGTNVTVRILGAPNDVAIEVHNWGAPISENAHAGLFEPMQRGATRADLSTRSVGLGLYIVKHIVDAHRGSIEVRSTMEEGTTFTARLPRSER